MDFLKYIFSKCDFNLILKNNNNKITMGLLNNIKDAILIIVSKKKNTHGTPNFEFKLKKFGVCEI